MNLSNEMVTKVGLPSREPRALRQAGVWQRTTILRQFALKLAEKRVRYFFPSLFAISMNERRFGIHRLGARRTANRRSRSSPAQPARSWLIKFHIVNQLTHAVNLNE